VIETLPPRTPTDFDAVAAVYDESLPAHVVAHYLDKRLAFIRQHVPPGPALDVGCGTGLLAERLADAGYDVVGLDPSRGMLRQLHRRRPDVPGVAASGTDIPFADETFALTYCIAVMHHVAAPEAVLQTLREMARVTRPGGHVLIWDHNPRNPYWPLLMKRVPQDTGAERLIPTEEIVAGLEAGGARPVLIRQTGFVPDFAPRRLLPVAAAAERVVEAAPVVNRLCAHNVVLAVKD
jgi:SAM-dependent methyltransferase